MTPGEIKKMDQAQLKDLAAGVRETIIGTLSKNGGHLASSLGAVELTVALLRVFDPPEDKIVWDVGHQTYAWKILTDRKDRFPAIRKRGGLAPFSSPEESPYDAFVAGHAGVAMAAAEGMAAARDRSGGKNHVVAVIGDASLSNGCNLEALNNCEAMTKKLILVVNDNRMSISKNVGAMARFLGRLLSGVRYNKVKAKMEQAGHRMHLTFLRGLYHRLERVVKSIWLGNSFFESFGMRYIGPVDGHDMAALESAFTVARDDKRSVVIHVVTEKGKGFGPSESDPAKWHGVGPFDLENPSVPEPKHDWSSAFGAVLRELAAKDGKICALTAAMRDGTGLSEFAAEFPDRFFDVGICEEHLVTFAAGLASSGMKPVVAVYSTFLQRAVDQVMHDVCIGELPVVVGIDRAGIVGADGKTHNGMYDIPMLRCIPNLSVCQPRNVAELRMMMDSAIERGKPVAIRYPRGCPPPDDGSEPAPVVWGKAEIVLPAKAGSLWIWALGDQVPKACRVAEILAAKGVEAGVVNARFAKPVDRDLLAKQAGEGSVVATMENGALAGGFGSAVREALSGFASAKVESFGWPDEFIAQGTVGEIEKEFGFTAEDIASRLMSKTKEV